MNRWSGEFCNITCPDSSKSDEDHIWHYCNDNGICKEGKCICNDGYSKTPTGSCEKCDDSICHGHGKCTSNSTCECEDRYIIYIIIYLDGQVIFVLCIVILNLIVVVMVNVYMMDHVVAKSIIILQIVVNIVLKIQLVVIMVIVLKKVNVNVKIDILEIIVQLLDLIHPLHLIV